MGVALGCRPVGTPRCRCYHLQAPAEVVELVDTQRSGRCARKGVRVRFPSSAPNSCSSALPLILPDSYRRSLGWSPVISSDHNKWVPKWVPGADALGRRLELRERATSRDQRAGERTSTSADRGSSQISALAHTTPGSSAILCP